MSRIRLQSFYNEAILQPMEMQNFSIGKESFRLEKMKRSRERERIFSVTLRTGQERERGGGEGGGGEKTG